MVDEHHSKPESNVNIRRIGSEDMAKMRALNALFGVAFEDPENYLSGKPRDSYLADFLRDVRNIVIIAECEGYLVGGLVAYCLVKFERERKEVYLYDLAVAREFRRQGIGKALLHALRQVAKQLGAYLLFVQADEGDDAIVFYESLDPSENIKTRNFDFEVR